jgi:uncharacterized membrane protein
MRFFLRFTQGELHLTRIEAFSDGVSAVAVTLLVLDLKVPVLNNPAGVGELAQALLDQLPKLLSWLISFIIVCKFWLNHHHILGSARHADYGFVWLNSIFLLGQSFIPFPTAMVGRYPKNALAVSFFGCVFALNTLLFMALQAYIARRLIKPELATLQDPSGLREALRRPIVLSARRRCGMDQYAGGLRNLFYITPTHGSQASAQQEAIRGAVVSPHKVPNAPA